MAPEALRTCYPEFAGREGACRFAPCLHDREPGCAVREAVQAGEISPERYERYRILLHRCGERWKNATIERIGGKQNETGHTGCAVAFELRFWTHGRGYRLARARRGGHASPGRDGRHVRAQHFLWPAVIRAVRALTKLPLDVHMMVQAPERYIDEIAACGADIITVHAEATPHVHRALQRIRENGKIAGVALNPGTQAEALRYLLDEVGLVLVMTVNPGFGGQKMIPAALEKIGAVRAMLDAAGSEALLEVDGGVTAETRSCIPARARRCW